MKPQYTEGLIWVLVKNSQALPPEFWFWQWFRCTRLIYHTLLDVLDFGLLWFLWKLSSSLSPSVFHFALMPCFPRFRHYYYGLWGFSLGIKIIYNMHMLIYMFTMFSTILRSTTLLDHKGHQPCPFIELDNPMSPEIVPWVATAWNLTFFIS